MLFRSGGRDGAWAGANLGVLAALLIGLVGHLALGRGRVRAQEADGGAADGDGARA